MAAAPVTTAAAAARSVVLAGPQARRRFQGKDAVSSFRVPASSSRRQILAASFPSLRMQRVPQRFLQVSCNSAKQDTIDKVCEIVKNQLALAEDTVVTGETKFGDDLGADSLDTVEIVMGLEEAFQITVDESSAQEIHTVHDAAALIDKLLSDNKDDA